MAAKRKTGPKPDTLKIDGDWRSAIKKAIDKKPPKKSWSKSKPAKHP